MRVVIADDEALVCGGLRLLLENQPGIDIVGEAHDGLAAVDLVRAARPDVVLMDIRMPIMDGLEAARRIVALDAPPRVVMLTTFGEDEYVYEALRIGVSGFLLKSAPPEDFVRAVTVAGEGHALLDPRVTKRLIAQYAPRGQTALPAGWDELTPREHEVFLLLSRGLSNADIAETMVVSHATVKTHVNRVLVKLGLRDRTQVVVLAYEAGVVVPGDPEAPGSRATAE